MKIDRRMFFLGSAAALASPSVRAQALPEPSDAERAAMAEAAQAFLKTHSLPAVSIAFAKGDQLLYRGAWGFANRSANEVATPDHRFRIASLSKPVTAVAIFTLIQAGKLSLDQPVFGPTGALGKLGEAVKPDMAFGTVNVGHLLTHTAGGWSNDPGSSDPTMQQPWLTHAQVIAYGLATGRQSAAPGTTYIYSNFGYCLLGRIVENISGKSYEDYVREAVLASAGAGGMKLADATPAAPGSGEVRYYTTGSDAADPYALPIRRLDSAGGWLATPSELALFGAAVGSATSPSPLNATSVAQMLKTTTANPGYAHGWNVNASNGNSFHTGSLQGSQTLLIRTRGGVAWAVFLNTRNRAVPDVLRDLTNLGWTMARKVPAWRV
jgi:CubicO group peptidase (beta-lactamase class C family)